MQVNVIDVAAIQTHSAKNGRQYQSIEVMYKNDAGQAQNKKLMSFANPAVFKASQTWAKGDVIHVSTEKDTSGYWQWTAVGEAGTVEDKRDDGTAQGTTPNTAAASTTTRVSGSNYETKDERAARQVMIVRQSSLSNAIATLNIKGTKDLTESPSSAVIALAKLYEGFVLGEVANGAMDITDLADDIPL